MIFHFPLESSEDGWIVAECPVMPRCFSQGRTEREALTNIRESIIGRLYAETQKQNSSALH